MNRLVLCFALLLCLAGCSKSAQSINNNDEYYVKYVFEGGNTTGYNIYRNCKITFTGETGKQVDMSFGTSHLSYEMITGPFKYHDKVSATFDGGGFTYMSIQIYVSKNNSPFALKCLSNGGYLEYTIDY